MGDIADMMLEGILCEGCGEFIDEDGDEGVPRYCSEVCAASRGMTYIPPTKRLATTSRRASRHRRRWR